MNFNIRKGQPSESELLSDLALRSKAYWGYSQEFIDACRKELTYSPEDIQSNHIFVAEIDNSIVGFYALAILSPIEIELEALFIEPVYIGQGYGRKLIDHAKTISHQLGRQVIIIQGDPNAASFYLAVGGKLIGETESTSIPDRYLPTFMIQI
ncbi:MAG: GNAT family N-acetyltransferase [Pleurocapsa sp. MO_192.B19]|nr:GNAT family N-acetyltransferase [Pleurocapsa sp. MO_192.B19]